MNAIEQLKSAISSNPNDPGLHYDLGGLYLAALSIDAAIKAYRDALDLAPNHPQILLQLGNCHSKAGRYAQAISYFKNCIHADANNDAAYFNLANAHRELGEPSEAAAAYRNALKINPNDADTHNNLGNVLRELGQLELAIASYETALKIKPNLHHAKVHLVHQKQHVCDWRGLYDDVAIIESWVENQPAAQVSPFAFIAMPGSLEKSQLKCSSNWLNNRYKELIKLNKEISFNHSVVSKDKLKIGYLSADFRLHPLAFLITDLIQNHDRSKFEIHAYSYGMNDQTDERKSLETAFDYFNDIQNLNLMDSAKKIHSDEIDILVDLTGFTQTSRSGIAVLKPAPIQINWLGFPGSMGCFENGQPLFDYMISDDTVTPTDSKQYYAEDIISLPCYQPNSHRPSINKPSRSECGLDEDAFVFCCFNQTFKILPHMFDIWMRLLKAKPNSVLWLLDCNDLAKKNLVKEAQQRGIDAERLVFAPRVSITQHMARQSHADLFLDTLPYNAHTTCSDALWAGVPVLTCVGDTFSGRVAASLLKAAQLPELITDSLQAYEDLALDLATHPSQLNTIKDKLTTNKHALPLFNVAHFTLGLEQAYTNIWQKKLSL